MTSFHSAPPDITVEKSWVHASEGCDVDLVCIVQGDVNSDVSTLSLGGFSLIIHRRFIPTIRFRCCGIKTRSFWTRLTAAQCT